jgi:hypothetical protein
LKPSKEELNQVMINVYLHLVYRNILMEARFSILKICILPGLVDPDVLPYRLYREWKVQMKVLPISMYAVGQTTEFNALGHIKMYHSGHFLQLLIIPTYQSQQKTELAPLAMMEFRVPST